MKPTSTRSCTQRRYAGPGRMLQLDWEPSLSQSSDRAPSAAPVPRSLVQGLAGKRFALIGFDDSEARRLSAVLEVAQVVTLALKLSKTLQVGECDLVVMNVNETIDLSSWLTEFRGKPVLLAGSRDSVLQLELLTPSVRTIEFVISPWTAEEVLLRARLALSKHDTGRPSSPAAKINIVIADDDPSIVAILKATLRNHGMECRGAGEGAQALEIIRSEPPDVVLLDLNMPDLDGFEVLAELKNDERTRDIRVILLSAREQEADIIRGFALGADDYVVKPFSPMELAARVKRLARKEA